MLLSGILAFSAFFSSSIFEYISEQRSMRFLKEVVLFLLALLLGSISILTYEVVDTSGDSFSTIGHSHIYAAPIHRHFHEPPPNNFLRGGFSTQRLIVDKRDSHDT